VARILLVENNSLLGRLLSMYLLDDGHEVSRVNGASETQERLLDSSLDLIIFNTGLPAEEKARFINSWREVAPTVSVLEISVSPLIIANAGTDFDAVGKPDAYLPIPLDFDALPDVIKDCLEARQ
jgi:DNA-binding NtrC family response regulator